MIGEAMMGAAGSRPLFDMAKALKDIDDRTPGTTGRSWGAIAHDPLRLTADCILRNVTEWDMDMKRLITLELMIVLAGLVPDAASRRCANKRGAK
jgi:hypothetical protein